MWKKDPPLAWLCTDLGLVAHSIDCLLLRIQNGRSTHSFQQQNEKAKPLRSFLQEQMGMIFAKHLLQTGSYQHSYYLVQSSICCNLLSKQARSSHKHVLVNFLLSEQVCHVCSGGVFMARPAEEPVSLSSLNEGDSTLVTFASATFLLISPLPLLSRSSVKEHLSLS